MSRQQTPSARLRRLRTILATYCAAALDAEIAYTCQAAWSGTGTKPGAKELDRLSDLRVACSMIASGIANSIAWPSLGTAVAQMRSEAKSARLSSSIRRADWLDLVVDDVEKSLTSDSYSLRGHKPPASPEEPAPELPAILTPLTPAQQAGASRILGRPIGADGQTPAEVRADELAEQAGEGA